MNKNFDGAKDQYIECLQEEVFRLTDLLREEMAEKTSNNKDVFEKNNVNAEPLEKIQKEFLFENDALHAKLEEKDEEIRKMSLSFEKHRETFLSKTEAFKVKIDEKNDEVRKLVLEASSKDMQLQMLETSLQSLIKSDLEKLASEKLSFTKRSKRAKDALEVLSSELFDLKWYVSNYGKSIRDQNPILHYLDNEHSLTFNPSLSFDVARYAEKYPDVVMGAKSILLHYIRHGCNENRVKFEVKVEKS